MARAFTDANLAPFEQVTVQRVGGLQQRHASPSEQESQQIPRCARRRHRSGGNGIKHSAVERTAPVSSTDIGLDHFHVAEREFDRDLP